MVLPPNKLLRGLGEIELKASENQIMKQVEKIKECKSSRAKN